MGLDSILYRRVYLSRHGQFANVQIFPHLGRVEYVLENLHRWRKNFTIHNWFIYFAADSEAEDERQRVLTSFDLLGLKGFCEDALSKANEDPYFRKDLEDAIALVDRIAEFEKLHPEQIDSVDYVYIADF